MDTNNDIRIITITPGKCRGLHVVAAILSAKITPIKSDDIPVCDEDTGTIEILAQKIHEFEIHARPAMTLSAPTVKALSPRRDNSNMLKNYNRMQNAKYNTALRNYKGRKK